MSGTTWLFMAGVILASAAIQGATGFGFAVFAVPLLMLSRDAHEVVIVCTLLGIVVSFWVALARRRHLDRELLKGWTIGAIIGLPIGLGLFVMLPQRVLAVIVGTSMGILALVILTRVHLSGEQPQHRKVAVGIPAGILAATVAMPGPPIALYSAWTRCPKHRFQATSAAFGCIASLFALCGYGLAGQVHMPQLLLALTLVPALGVGVVLGLTVHNRISQVWFDRLILVLIVGLSVSLLAKSH